MNVAGQIFGNTLNTLAERIDKATEEKKKSAQMAGVLRKKLALVDPARKDDFAVMSLPELMGEDEGLAVKSAQAREQRESRLAEARLNELMAAEDERQRMGTFNQMMALEPSFALTPENIVGRAAQAGVLGNRAFDLDALMRAGEGGTAADFMPQQFDIGGIKGIVSPRTGSIHLTERPGSTTVDDRLRLLDRRALWDMKRTLENAKSRALLPAEKADYDKRIAEVEGQLAGMGRTSADEVAAAEAYARQLAEERQKAERIAAGGTAAEDDEELRMAREALKAGRAREKVAALYKQRTGKDLPP